ncbi:MAG: hypothetical protein EP334_10645 [Gammaproteobacteria bacterium]|nr:MAG: hypothetical protein EP334_10645 [Gammaproteobacteria bacterium]
MNAVIEKNPHTGLDTEACYGALGFSMAPFNITPDTDFLLLQHQYREAYTSLRFGLASGSFTLLTGDVGLGKTLLCRQLIKNLPANVRTAYIFNPQQNYEEFLSSILYDLTGEMPTEVSSARLHDSLFNVLASFASRSIRVALLIDEAHLLPPNLLEGLRMLSNLETDKRKLLSLLLVGQNELERTLKLPAMRALRQRISVWYRLRPFTWRESRDYIRHRLQVADASGRFHITSTACLVAHRYAHGVPRRINQICDRALLAAYSSYQHCVNAKLMRSAAKEVIALEAV